MENLTFTGIDNTNAQHAINAPFFLKPANHPYGTYVCAAQVFVNVNRIIFARASDLDGM